MITNVAILVHSIINMFLIVRLAEFVLFDIRNPEPLPFTEYRHRFLLLLLTTLFSLASSFLLFLGSATLIINLLHK